MITHDQLELLRSLKDELIHIKEIAIQCPEPLRGLLTTQTFLSIDKVNALLEEKPKQPVDPHAGMHKCTACDGTGQVRTGGQGSCDTPYSSCDFCNGRGWIVDGQM